MAAQGCFVYVISITELVLSNSKFIFSSITLPVAFGLNTFDFG